MSIILNNLSFGYISPLIENLSCRFEKGWSAVVGTNGSGKTTLLNLITSEIVPDAGTVEIKGEYLYCRQLIEDIPEEALQLFNDYSKDSYRLKIKFGLKDNWPDIWHKLSFGEKKRIQTASAFYLNPEVLILDEPTNHLDSKSRELLISALRTFRGTGLIVSHDRFLLDSLPYQTLFLEPPKWELRGQSYSQAVKERELEVSYITEQRKIITKNVKKLKSRASDYRSLSGNADKRRSKKTIGRKDHDAKAKIDAARLTGKDATHGKLLNQMQGRIRQEEEKLQNHQRISKASFDFSLHFEPGRRRILFSIDEGQLQMGNKTLSFKGFQLDSEDKAALTGVNGSGKSTLLNYIYSSCRKEKTLYIPQELEQNDISLFFNSINQLDSIERGRIYSIMSAIGSDPQRVLSAETPSPGEIRKLLIADAIRKKLDLMILDEPTNHLDLHSIEALESALKEYRAGLVVVSHDHKFIENSTSLKWEIVENDKKNYVLKLQH